MRDRNRSGRASDGARAKEPPRAKRGGQGRSKNGVGTDAGGEPGARRDKRQKGNVGAARDHARLQCGLNSVPAEYVPVTDVYPSCLEESIHRYLTIDELLNNSKLLAGWTILCRVRRARGWSWALGTVVGAASIAEIRAAGQDNQSMSEMPNAQVQFEAGSDDGEPTTLLSLRLANYGDGSTSSASFVWFRIQLKTEFEAAQEKQSEKAREESEKRRRLKEAREEFQRRCLRRLLDVEGDGLCGWRVLAIFLRLLRGFPRQRPRAANTDPDGLTFEDIREVLDMVGNSSKENAVQIATAAGAAKGSSQAEQDSMADDIVARGEMLCQMEPVACLGDRNKYFGGEDLSDFASAAIEITKEVYVMADSTNDVHRVHPDGSVTLEQLSEIAPGPDALVMENVNGNHWVAYITTDGGGDGDGDYDGGDGERDSDGGVGGGVGFDDTPEAAADGSSTGLRSEPYDLWLQALFSIPKTHYAKFVSAQKVCDTLHELYRRYLPSGTQPTLKKIEGLRRRLQKASLYLQDGAAHYNFVLRAARIRIKQELIENHAISESNAAAILEKCEIKVVFFRLDFGERIARERTVACGLVPAVHGSAIWLLSTVNTHKDNEPFSCRNLAGLCRLPQVQRHKSAAAAAAAARSAVAPWGAAMSALNDSATGRVESLRALFTRLLRRRLFQRSIKEMWRLWRGLVGAPTVLRKRIWSLITDRAPDNEIGGELPDDDWSPVSDSFELEDSGESHQDGNRPSSGGRGSNPRRTRRGGHGRGRGGGG
eukprot:CAMPEP_0119465860 /NCGR_PEP_ID=MMETSP1344-20130328/785_1 /TAXON_ID=236787 /ORGANISM="Florenciella parvula, Strain CCMP2471" /LENGTH=767 /DNA_ID=CAMNT_0007498145 /DNA_START=116 /DNA_END=2415 /DNA_ORIENTATION=+